MVTFKREWVDYCQKNPGYQQVYHEDRFRIFTRNSGVGSYFLKGHGELRFEGEGFYLKPKENEIVLKFRYLPKLKLFPPEAGELYPVFAFDEELGGGKKQNVEFVGLKVTPEFLSNQTELKIGYYGP